VRIVDLAVGIVPSQVTCLPRSLAVWSLLKRWGVESSLRIGVRRAGSNFAAHSWIEVDGNPVTDPETVIQQFEPFAEPVTRAVIRGMR
jgi:hypothetical protein